MLRFMYGCGAIALLLGISHYAPAAEPVTETNRILEELAKLNTNLNARLDQLEQSIAKTKNEIAGLDERLYRLQREAVTNDELRAAKNQLELLQREVDALRSRVGTTRESFKPGPGVPPSTSQSISGTESGIFRITNDHVVPMDVRINGISYPVNPGQVATVSMPPGPFTYQVMGVDAVPRQRTIVAGKDHPIRIYPR